MNCGIDTYTKFLYKVNKQIISILINTYLFYFLPPKVLINPQFLYKRPELYIGPSTRISNLITDIDYSSSSLKTKYPKFSNKSICILPRFFKVLLSGLLNFSRSSWTWMRILTIDIISESTRRRIKRCGRKWRTNMLYAEKNSPILKEKGKKLRPIQRKRRNNAQCPWARLRKSTAKVILLTSAASGRWQNWLTGMRHQQRVPNP